MNTSVKADNTMNADNAVRLIRSARAKAGPGIPLDELMLDRQLLAGIVSLTMPEYAHISAGSLSRMIGHIRAAHIGAEECARFDLSQPERYETEMVFFQLLSPERKNRRIVIFMIGNPAGTRLMHLQEGGRSLERREKERSRKNSPDFETICLESAWDKLYAELPVDFQIRAFSLWMGSEDEEIRFCALNLLTD